jgi:YVTN family beta-propeller protein
MYPFSEWEHVFPQMAANAKLSESEKNQVLEYLKKVSESAAERRETALVLDESRNALYFVDVARREMVGKAAFPRILGLTPDGANAIVEQDGKLQQLILAVNKVKEELAFGQAFDEMAILPDRRHALARSSDSQRAFLLDLQDSRILSEVRGSFALHGAATVDGRLAYAVDSENDRLVVIDAQAGQELAEITVGDNPQGVALPLAGRYGYVPNAGSNDVSVFEISTQEIVATIAVGDGPHDALVTPLGSHVYVANSGSGTVSVIEVDSHQVVATLEAGRRPLDMAFTPDGQHVFVVIQGPPPAITVISFSDQKVVGTIPLVGSPHEILIR